MISIRVRNGVDSAKIAGAIKNDDAFWTFAANEWRRLIDKFTPFRDGDLSRNVTIEPKKITYEMPYAWRIYHGDGFNFRKDKNPLACAHWDEAARASEEPKLTAALQEYLKSGRVKFG